MKDGGYARATLWLMDGFAAAGNEGWQAPGHWRKIDGEWRIMTLGGLRPVDPAAPVCHVSYYEADAFARWSGKHLPTEMEWEVAARAGQLNDAFGIVWQWTRSAYSPYPGYRAIEGALGEYNGKFMVNQLVLRGSSLATPDGHSRITYRNFFYPHHRWQFTGLRLADYADCFIRSINRAGKRVQESIMNVHAPALAKAHRVRRADLGIRPRRHRGLSQQPKQLSPKYFYDAAGSELFEQITRLPEYYPTRTELGILRDRGGEIAAIIPKARRWWNSAPAPPPRSGCCWSDANSPPMCRSIYPATFSTRRPTRCAGISPASTSIRWRRISPRRSRCPTRSQAMPKVGFFPGSTLGNFEPHEACAFLRSAREILGQGAQMMIGVDLEKDERVLYDAYNDAAGVTARFNLNVLVRINRELGGNFDLSAFTHRAIYNRERHRIEMHLISRKAQTVRVLGRSFSFRPGESIHTESSYKYSLDRFTALARGSGWTVRRSWTDAAGMFSVHALVARGLRASAAAGMTFAPRAGS